MLIASALGLDDDDRNLLAVLVRPDGAMRQGNVRELCTNLVRGAKMEGSSTYSHVVFGRDSANEAWNRLPTADVDSAPRLRELWMRHAIGGAHKVFVLGMRVATPNEQSSATGERRLEPKEDK